MTDTKTCSKCSETKPVSEFYNGMSSRCKECKKAEERARYRADRDKTQSGASPPTHEEGPSMGTEATLQNARNATEGARAEDTPPRYSFAELLDLLGHVDDYRHDQVAVCWKFPGGTFTPELLTTEYAPPFVDHWTASPDRPVDVWFSVNPIDSSVTTGRGTARDVTRLAALYADVDVKPGACPDVDTAHGVIADLSVVLGERPGAIIHSGHGLQPLWPVDRESAEKLSNPEAQKLSNRFGRLVADIASRRDIALDKVSDLARVLRVPNTINVKDPERPAPTWCESDTGTALTVERIAQALEDYGLVEIASDAALTGAVISAPDGWQYGDTDCSYAVAMVAPWNHKSDEPKGGRHQWAMCKAVRLAAAHRLGCITEDGLTASLEHLAQCLEHWCATVGDPRGLQPDEIDGAYRWAMEKVATLTDEQTRKELGDHKHQEDGVTGAPADKFDNEVADVLHRLRVGDAARKQLASEKVGPAPPFDSGLLGEILARPEEPPHRIHKLLPADGGMLVVAQRKTGKTTLMLNLARSLITAEPFLGTYTTIPARGRVAILNYEVSGGQLGRWADQVAVPADRLLLVNLRGRRDPLSHREDRARLADLLREHQVESLIVDPFGRAYTGASQNDSGEVGAWLVDLDTFTRTEVGARDLILTAHAGWNGERTRGSSSLEDWADSIVTMTLGSGDDDKSRYLRAIGRDVSVDEDRLHFDPDTRLLSLTGGGSRKEATRNAKVETLVAGVCDFLNENPGASFGDINTSVQGRQADKRSAIELAESRGLLRRDVGGPGKPTKHFRADPIRSDSASDPRDGVVND